MEFNSLSILLLILVATLFLYILLFNKKNTSKVNESQENLYELKGRITQLKEDREKLEVEKKSFETKNKKIWAMSEAVHKEKHKVDEQNELLKTEKEKIQLEKNKVDEKIKKLWQTSTAVHKEKERIDILRLEVEEKHQEMVDSVNYAKRIQEAILPPVEEISNYFTESFVLFKPRDIVSGDFYWFYQKDHIAVIASCDCTGHGVPGAFMSMIGNTLLNEIVIEKGNTQPAKILTLLDEAVKNALKQTRDGNESRDGMDLALCVIDKKENKVQYAGANRPLYVFENVNGTIQFQDIKPSKFPIGGHDFADSKLFTQTTIENCANKRFYLFSDGYADQFGGVKGKKLMLKNLQRMLEELQHENLNAQKKSIDEYFTFWKGSYDQIDDVLMIGFSV